MPLAGHRPVLALPKFVHRFPVQGLVIETLKEKLACLKQSIITVQTRCSVGKRFVLCIP
jgi:hypothetical protein